MTKRLIGMALLCYLVLYTEVQAHSADVEPQITQLQQQSREAQIKMTAWAQKHLADRFGRGR